jgi:hypothetical protein
MIELDEFAVRSIAVRNDPDAAARDAAVTGQGFVFRPLGAAQAHHDSVRIRWE